MLATFETEYSARHLETLCRHFGKKVQAECSADAGWVQFPFGRCEMTADQNRLNLHACASTQSQLDEVVTVVTSHLERFAFRENPILEWHRADNMTSQPPEGSK